MHVSHGGLVITALMGEFWELGWRVGKPARTALPFHRSWEMAPRFLCSCSVYPVRCILCERAAEQQQQQQHRGSLPSFRTAWAEQPCQAWRRAVLAVTWGAPEAAPGKDWELFPELGSAPPPAPHLCRISITAVGQSLLHIPPLSAFTVETPAQRLSLLLLSSCTRGSGALWSRQGCI